MQKMSKLGFSYPDRILVRIPDFQNKIGRILTRSGGLDSLLTVQDENKVTQGTVL